MDGQRGEHDSLTGHRSGVFEPTRRRNGRRCLSGRFGRLVAEVRLRSRRSARRYHLSPYSQGWRARRVRPRCTDDGDPPRRRHGDQILGHLLDERDRSEDASIVDVRDALHAVHWMQLRSLPGAAISCGVCRAGLDCAARIVGGEAAPLARAAPDHAVKVLPQNVVRSSGLSTVSSWTSPSATASPRGRRRRVSQATAGSRPTARSSDSPTRPRMFAAITPRWSGVGDSDADGASRPIMNGERRLTGGLGVPRTASSLVRVKASASAAVTGRLGQRVRELRRRARPLDGHPASRVERVRRADTASMSASWPYPPRSVTYTVRDTRPDARHSSRITTWS